MDCMFIEYAQNNIAYRFLVLKVIANLFDENNIIESKDAKFFQDFFLIKLIVERSLPYVEDSNDPPNLGRCYDDPFDSGRCSSNPPKTERCSDIPLKGFEQELRRS